jgi:hypothetical protein
VTSSVEFPAGVVTGPAHTRSHFVRLGRRQAEFGLYDSSGTPLPDCDTTCGRLSSRPADRRFPNEPTKRLDGPVLFAGLSREQFGHVITTSIGRLWALEHLPSGTRLLYMPRKAAFLPRYPHLEPILRLFGIEAPPVLVDGPLEIAETYTATDLFGERYEGAGSPEFFDWIDRTLPPGPEAHGARKLYVTRSRLGPDVGRFCCEDLLESLLAEAGYEIFAPEEHSLSSQIAVYRAASYLVFSESSALHLFGLVRRPNQRVAIIQRRHALPLLIENQLRARTGEEIAAIDAIDAVWWRPVWADNSAIVTLDFARLRDALREAGLLPPGTAWRLPTAEETARSLRWGLVEGEALMTDEERAVWVTKNRAERRMQWQTRRRKS